MVLKPWFSPWPEPRRQPRTVVILGAGASFGCESQITPRPPLMRDFIRLGRRRRLRYDYAVLWRFLRSLGLTTSSLDQGTPNLEELYALVQSISRPPWIRLRLEWERTVGRHFPFFTPERLLESFIIEVLASTSRSAISRPCAHHARLFAGLGYGDVVVTFNYDLIADATLSRSGRWCAYDGYGFQADILGEDPSEVDRSKASDALLLKLHGSLNWYLRDLFPHETEVERKARKIKRPGRKASTLPHQFDWLRSQLTGAPPATRKRITVVPVASLESTGAFGLLAREMDVFYRRLRRRASPDRKWLYSGLQLLERQTLIVPPLPSKLDGQMAQEMAEVWSFAFQALQQARRIVFIGYSFPPGDHHVISMIRYALASRRRLPDEFVVVDPDPSGVVAHRVSGLPLSPRVLRKSFAAFIAHDWD